MAPDADVTAYAAAVTTAGGTLPASHQLALNTYIPALKTSGAWALIKEMWLPLGNDGDLTTAAVKLKNGVTGVPSVTLTNFVVGDYTVAGGMDPQLANSTKKILTGFIPSTASLNGVLAVGEWGFGVYNMRPTTSATGALMGTVTGQASYLQYTGNSSCIIANSASWIGNPDTGPLRTKRWVGVQVSANVGTYYMGGYARNTAAIAAPTAVGIALGVLTANAGLFSDAAVGGYAIHATLTPAQIRAIQTFIDNVGTAIGRNIWINDLIANGDSYVAPAPTGPSVPANDWVALVAGVKGWSYSLSGISGRTWGPASGGNLVGSSGVASVALNCAATASKHVVFPLGINDANFSGTAAQVTSATNGVLDVLNSIGYPLSYIALGTGYWASTLNATLQGQIAAATSACGVAYGVNVCDFYNGSTFGNVAVETSGIHKNDAGHVLLKNDMISAMAGWAGW